MDNMNIIKYLLEALNNRYLDELEVISNSGDLIKVLVIVNNEMLIRPVLMMIEANMYTRKELLAYRTVQEDNRLKINTFNNVDYIIEVASKEGKEHKNEHEF